MIENKIVIRFKDSRIFKGKTKDFFPNKSEFHLEVEGGETIKISIEELKAIFFVKNFEGNKEYKEDYKDEVPGGGRKVKVEFIDGETMIGFTLGYSPDRQGFFLNPADLKSNNERIFIIKSATENVSFI